MKTDMGLLLLRIVSGGLMLTHGWPKFMKLISGNTEFPDPLGIGSLPTLILAVLAEFVCAILVIVGFRVRWTTIPIIITMLVAVVIVHGNDPIARKELPLLYAAAFGAISMAGSGKWSLDAWLSKRKGGGRG